MMDMKSDVEDETQDGDDADNANAEAYSKALREAIGNYLASVPLV